MKTLKLKDRVKAFYKEFYPKEMEPKTHSERSAKIFDYYDLIYFAKEFASSCEIKEIKDHDLHNK